MITIQPNITHYSKQKALPSFKGENSANIISAEQEDEFFKNKTEFYESQIKDLDASLNNDKTPEAFKKVIKGFKIVSEGLLEGWAVAWGASKGSRVVKSSIVKTIEKEGSKTAQEVLTPFGEKIQKYGSKIFDAIGKGFEKLTNTTFAKNTGAKFSKFIDKMRDNSVGKYIVNTFEYIGNFISDKIIKPLKGVKPGEVYDKATKVTSTTLGVGAGAAGAYNATDRSKSIQAEKEINESADDLEYDFEEIGE